MDAKDLIYIPALSKRKSIAYCVLSIKDSKYYLFDNKTCDLSVAKEMTKYDTTLVAIHSTYHLYGVAKDRPGHNKPSLWWLREEEYKQVCNRVLDLKNPNIIIDLSSRPLDSIKHANEINRLFSIVYISSTTPYKVMAFNTFKEQLLGISTAPTLEAKQIEKEVEVKEVLENSVKEGAEAPVVEAPAKVVKTPEKEIKTSEKEIKAHAKVVETSEKEADAKGDVIDKVENKSNTIDKVETPDKVESTPDKVDIANNTLKTLTKVATVMNKAALAMTNEATSLNKEKNKFKDIIDKLSGTYDLDEMYIDVADISNSSTNNELEMQAEADDVTLHSIYDTVLKLMKQNDSMSIPKIYYSKLVNTIKRNISLARDGSRYDAIVEIRFYENAEKTILARVEYNESLDDTRVTIIKPFNSSKVSDVQITEYMIKFNQWRKRNSFTSSY